MSIPPQRAPSPDSGRPPAEPTPGGRPDPTSTGAGQDGRAPRLSSQTLNWLAHHPRDRELVRSVWDTLTELERAGQQPGPIAALRSVLTHHQPTPAGRCRTCSRAWRRRPFPCTVWHQIRGELLGLFAGSHHREPAGPGNNPRT